MISRFGKTVSLVLVALVLQLAVQAKPAAMGKLKTRNNKTVTVNGHKANSGTTLMSGSSIECPAKVGATIDLGPLGRIDIAPNSSLTVTFSEGVVSVQLHSGYVVLTTSKGISGTVNTADGEVFRTNSAQNSSVIGKTKGVNGPQTAASVGASSGGMSTGAAVGVAGAGSAVVGGAAVKKSSDRGSQMSPDKP